MQGEGGLSVRRFPLKIVIIMSIFRLSLRVALIATAFIWVHGQDELDKALVPKSSADQAVVNAIKSPGLTVVHLWAPWCSNCQAELKTGGWLKTIKDNPQVRFCFVSIWNDGGDGRAMLKKFQIADQPNVTIVADPGPRRGENKTKQFTGLPVSWIPTTWIYKGGDLRYALNYGEIRFPVLQQFLQDSQSEWSHKGEASIE